ncbi:MAG TPA: hypothetical protein VL241_08275 [Gemmatimonadales bacterium]|nr:hypothetical protein [Gemmatimonadales bacterium]
MRRPLPALDARTWIVLPFENVARVADIDWLKDASVNLLYLDMSKWRDIRVIDDERVADLIREVPEARGQLTLQSGIAVARRAGAGKLVMGDLLKVGSRTEVVGKVFDVRTGERVRTVRQQATNADSIMAAFGQLAKGVLDVASPAGAAEGGGTGTQSIGAYRAYVLGVGYLNRWILDSAHAAFDRAITLDSSFALAHYKLALVYGWESSGSQAGRAHADAAQRLGVSLPERERGLVRGYAAFENRRYAEACEVFRGLLRADSSDVEAWYQLGECSFHDNVVEPIPGDTTHFAFRGSWNTALHAFRKTLQLDPTYHLAFQHIQDALLSSTRNGCRLLAGSDPCTTDRGIFQSFLRRAGDSLLTVPVGVADGIRELAQQAQAAAFERARTLNLREAQAVAADWLASGPGEYRPRVAYARILLRLGQIREADSLFRLVADPRMGRPEAAGLLTDRIEAAIKLNRVGEARRLADTLYSLTDGSGGGRVVGVLIRAVFGQTAGLGPAIEGQLTAAPGWVKSYYVSQARAATGAPADSAFSVEASFAANYARTQGAPRAAAATSVSLVLLDPRERGSRWPVTDTASPDPRLAAISLLALGDTVRYRQRRNELDSLGLRSDAIDAFQSLHIAVFRLAVRDSAHALAALRRFRDSTWARVPIMEPAGAGFLRAGMLWARTFLLLGDLEAAIGDRAAAISAYRFFLDLWQSADAENRPVVERARAALTRLTG